MTPERRQRRRNPLRGLRVRLALLASLLVAAVAIGSAVLFSRVANRELTHQFESTMGSLAANLSRNAAYGVFIESGDVLTELAENLKAEPDVLRVVILNAKGDVILERTKEVAGSKGGATGEVDSRVVYDAASQHDLGAEFAPFIPGKSSPSAKPGPNEIGTVKIIYSRARLESVLARVRNQVWVAALVAALIGSAIATWIATRMIEPLRTLSLATSAVAAGDLETKVAEVGGDEIAGLAQSFNRMIDALRGSRDKLAESYAELGRKERLATLGQFTAVIAHELRNPLGVILASAQVIANPKRTTEMKDRAATFIIEEVRRLNADLTSFLNFARPKPPEKRPISLVAVAQRAVDAWRNSSGSNSSMERTPPPGAPGADNHPDAGGQTGVIATVHDEGAPMASVDPDQVHQLLLNLLFNAAQALSVQSGHGHGEGRIDVRVRAHGDRVRMIVEDDGPGIPDDVRARIFEPFFTTRKRGSGLGLAVVDQVIRAHGGELGVDTEVGRGTRFILDFPAAEPVAAIASRAQRSSRT